MITSPAASDELSVVVLKERDGFSPLPGSDQAYRLEYRFVDRSSTDGFTAWRTAESVACMQVDVACDARTLICRFEQQALNRLVAQCLIRQRRAVLVIGGLWGCTVDLPRIADMLGIKTLFVLPDGQELPDQLDASTAVWLKDAFRRCRYIAANALPEALQHLVEAEKLVSHAALPDIVSDLSHQGRSTRDFNYSTYEFLSRDHPLLHSMQYRDVRFFEGSNRVLDVACGAGIFLDCLRRAGVDAVGVERDPMIAGYGVGMGLDIVNQDAMEYLKTTTDRFDGVYCSHFIEHLPIEAVQELIGLLYRRLVPGGLLVLVFPDPESIRSQLLGFWRDPEHVRFYHPELVSSIATVAGFTLEASSYDEQPHAVVGFEATPPQPPTLISMDSPPGAPAGPTGWLDTLLARFGLQSLRRAESSEEMWRHWAKQAAAALDSQRSYLEHLKQRSDKLWQVNATWSWNDNATILLRRSEGRDSSLL